MATYDHLPVYKESYDLLVLVFNVCRNMVKLPVTRKLF